jgi:hypothetical protein
MWKNDTYGDKIYPIKIFSHGDRAMKSKNSSLYTLWSLAIVVCVIMSFFALIFASCAKGGKTDDVQTPSDTLKVDTETPTEPAESLEPQGEGEPAP